MYSILETNSRKRMRMAYQFCFIFGRYIQVAVEIWYCLFAEGIDLSVSIHHHSVFSCHCNLDEWTNFLERIGIVPKNQDSPDEIMDDVRLWVSYRGQTLSRTGMQNITWITLACPKILPSFFWLTFGYHLHLSVRGMMYYREALAIQSSIDMEDAEG